MTALARPRWSWPSRSRLVRRLCPKCKEPYEVDDELAARHGLTPGKVFYRPKGCLHCRRLGYRGRLGVFEVIRITPRLTHLIQKRVPLDQLRKGAREEGMKMLYDTPWTRSARDSPASRPPSP